MNIKSEEEWAERAAAFLKHKLKDMQCRTGQTAQKAWTEGN